MGKKSQGEAFPLSISFDKMPKREIDERKEGGKKIVSEGAG